MVLQHRGCARSQRGWPSNETLAQKTASHAKRGLNETLRASAMTRPLETYGLRRTRCVENTRKPLVRMGRLELPRPLQALEPKCNLKAPSSTGLLLYQLLPNRQPPLRSTEERSDHADKLRTFDQLNFCPHRQAWGSVWACICMPNFL
jgi:hypothetical protein